MLPTLSASTRSFTAWNVQLEAYFSLKDITDEKRKLTILPSCLDESVLIRVVDYLALGTTTMKTALARLKQVWLDIRRPSNPERLFLEASFSQPCDASEMLMDLKWLAEYLNYDKHAVRQRFISAAPIELQPILISKTDDSVEDLCSFVLSCPTQAKANSVRRAQSTENRCTFCKKQGHSFATCRRRLGQCLRCGSSSHFVARCNDTKNE